MTIPYVGLAHADVTLYRAGDGTLHLARCDAVTDTSPFASRPLYALAPDASCRCGPTLAELRTAARTLRDAPSGRHVLVLRGTTTSRPEQARHLTRGFGRVVEAAGETIEWHDPAVCRTHGMDATTTATGRPNHHCAAIAVVPCEAGVILDATGVVRVVADLGTTRTNAAVDVARIAAEGLLVPGGHWPTLLAVAAMVRQRHLDDGRCRLLATLAAIATRHEPGGRPGGRIDTDRSDLRAVLDAAYWIAVDADPSLCDVLDAAAGPRRLDVVDAWALVAGVCS